MRALLLPALIVATSAHAADIDYRRYNFLHTGYSDKQLAPDEWRVKGSAHEMGGGVAVALYRAAELAIAAHADELRVTSQKVKELTVSRRFGNEIVGFIETATVTVRAVRSDADRTACNEKEQRRCMTLPVAGLLARFGERLGQPTARPGEAAGRPVVLVTYDRRQGGPAPWQVAAAAAWPEPVSIPVRTTPGLASLLGRLAASPHDRPAAAASYSLPSAAPLAGAPAVPLPATPVALRSTSSLAPRLSEAEKERARLQAAAAMTEAPSGVSIR